MYLQGAIMGSFASKLSKGRGEYVYLVRGKDAGRPAWHYVLIEKMKLPIFLEMVKGDSIDVAKYGKVLHSGWGEDPPEDIVKAVEAEFG